MTNYKSKKKNSKRSHSNSSSYVGYNQARVMQINKNKYDKNNSFLSKFLKKIKDRTKKKV